MGPTKRVEYYDDGNVKCVEWLDEAWELHNPHGPALQLFYEDGTLEVQEFYIDGKEHNTNGPSYHWFYDDGTLQEQSFYINGKLHNPNGAAVQWFHEDGTVWMQWFWIDGKELTEDEFNEWKSANDGGA